MRLFLGPRFNIASVGMGMDSLTHYYGKKQRLQVIGYTPRLKPLEHS